jgi:hypothetical protein
MVFVGTWLLSALVLSEAICAVTGNYTSCSPLFRDTAETGAGVEFLSSPIGLLIGALAYVRYKRRLERAWEPPSDSTFQA